LPVGSLAALAEPPELAQDGIFRSLQDEARVGLADHDGAPARELDVVVGRYPPESRCKEHRVEQYTPPPDSICN
jgi:hypothetical protein